MTVLGMAPQAEGDSSREAHPTREHLASQSCPMGGTHQLTQPVLWIGTSCRRCHRTWTGTGLVPTWPDLKP